MVHCLIDLRGDYNPGVCSGSEEDLRAKSQYGPLVVAEGIRPIRVRRCEIDLARRELRVLGSPVPLVGAPSVHRSSGPVGRRLVTKDELMNRIWPGAIVAENTLSSQQPSARRSVRIAVC
jgi:hypothetical protein